MIATHNGSIDFRWRVAQVPLCLIGAPGSRPVPYQVFASMLGFGALTWATSPISPNLKSHRSKERRYQSGLPDRDADSSGGSSAFACVQRQVACRRCTTRPRARSRQSRGLRRFFRRPPGRPASCGRAATHLGPTIVRKGRGSTGQRKRRNIGEMGISYQQRTPLAGIWFPRTCW